MKARITIIILIVIGIFLGVALIQLSKKAEEQKTTDLKTIVTFSNEVSQTSAKLEEERQVNITLTTNLNQSEREVARLSQTVKQTEADLKRAKDEAAEAARLANERDKKAEEMAKLLQEENNRRASKISELESERDALTKKTTELNGNIASLESKIADTEKKLQTSEGDRGFLLKELKRLMTEKSELERQFNNLAVLKEQLRKLRDEQGVSERLDSMRRGFVNTSGRKGGEVLQMGFSRAVTTTKTNVDLNVELRKNAPAKISPK